MHLVPNTRWSSELLMFCCSQQLGCWVTTTRLQLKRLQIQLQQTLLKKQFRVKWFRDNGLPFVINIFEKTRKMEKKIHRHEICDVATKTQTSLGCEIELEVQHESPLNRSCTSCQTQNDPACFKCFVASRNLFIGLQQQQDSNKNASKCDSKKALRKNTTIMTYASSFASLNKETVEMWGSILQYERL